MRKLVLLIALGLVASPAVHAQPTIVQCKTSGGAQGACPQPLAQAYIPLSSTTPAALGSAAVGTANTAARADHVHAHGNQAGGSLHPDVVAAGASGFMSGADKTKLDGIASGATNLALSSTTPAAIGTATAGVGTTAARSDHVHSLPGGGSTLPKANGGFGQSVASGLTFGQGVYVDSSGVLQIGNVPFEFDLSFYGGTTTNEYAIYPGNGSTIQLSAVGTPLFQSVAAGTCFLLTAQSDTPSSGTVTYRLRKSTNKGGVWSDLSSSVTCSYTNGTTTCSDTTNLGVISAGDWIQPTVQWTVSNGLGYFGGVRFKCRYN